MGVPIGRHRDEFDCSLLYSRITARIHYRNAEDAPGPEQLQSFRRSLRDSVRWRVCADHLLGRIVLDVSQENFPANLRGEPQSLFAGPGKEIKNKTDTTLRPAVDRICLLIESGPKADKMDRQVLSVGDEHISLRHD